MTDVSVDINNDSNDVVEIEEVDDPSGAPDPDDRQVAAYLDITTFDTTSGGTVTVTMSVDSLDSAGISPENATILHYADESWTELETTLVSESLESVTFQVEVDSFSAFAIASPSQTQTTTTTTTTTTDESAAGGGGGGGVGGGGGTFATTTTEEPTTTTTTTTTETTTAEEQTTTTTTEEQTTTTTTTTATTTTEETITTTTEETPPTTTATPPGEPGGFDLTQIGIIGLVLVGVVVLFLLARRQV